MATTTRMLLLGAVSLFGPVNGYQIRRELTSWRVDEWANIKPGSIYHGLAALAERGSLLRHDLPDGGRTVAVYEMADPGRQELRQLVCAGILTVNQFNRDEFHAAFAMGRIVGHSEMLDLLRRRLDRLSQTIVPDVLRSPTPYVPPAALRGAQLWQAEAAAELHWLRAVVADAEAGTLRLDDGDWTPPADDPGHQIEADRVRYLRLLGR